MCDHYPHFVDEKSGEKVKCCVRVTQLVEAVELQFKTQEVWP